MGAHRRFNCNNLERFFERKSKLYLETILSRFIETSLEKFVVHGTTNIYNLTLLFKDWNSSRNSFREIIRASDTFKIFGRFARIFYPFFISIPLSLRHLDHHARSIGSLNSKKKTRGQPESGADGRKRVPEKRCLRPGHQKLFHGGDPAAIHPCPRKGSLSLFLSFSLFPPDALSLFLLVLLSSPLPRENPPPFVKGDPTKSPTSHTCVQKGWREGERGWRGNGGGGSPVVGGGPREPQGRRCTHSSRYIMDTTENPLKGSTWNKGHPLPPPQCSPSIVSLPSSLFLAYTNA